MRERWQGDTRSRTALQNSETSLFAALSNPRPSQQHLLRPIGNSRLLPFQMTLTITVKNTAGARFELQIPALTETIADFKQRLSPHTGIPALQQRLIFRGHILRDTQTFADIRAKHGLETGHTMHVVPSRSSSSPSPPANPQTSSTPFNAQQRPSPSPTAPSMGGAPLGGFGMPSFQEMQNQVMQNPEQMQAVLNSPMMDRLMNNPEFARRIMMANPQMRELVESNPEIAHVLNDPSTLREMMQMARNPSLMNEMMRNSDRQMANIEMMPGGFDALRRMHETIQAPLMDAAQGGFQREANNTAEETNPFSSLFQNTPSNQPMPNPWAPNNTANQTPRNQPTTGNAFASLFNNPQQTPSNGTEAPQPPLGLGSVDTDQVMRMLENPMMQQMLESVLSDPQMFEAFVASSPEFQRMMRGNPQMAQMFRNPDMMRALLNPEFMRSMRSLQAGVNNANPSQTPATNSRDTNFNWLRPRTENAGAGTTEATTRIRTLRDAMRGPQDLPEFFQRVRAIAFPNEEHTGPALSPIPFSNDAPAVDGGMPAQILALMNTMRGAQDLPEFFQRVGTMANAAPSGPPLSAVPFTNPTTGTPSPVAAEVLRALREAMRNPSAFSQRSAGSDATRPSANGSANEGTGSTAALDGFMRMMQEMGPVNPQELTNLMQRMPGANGSGGPNGTAAPTMSQEQLEELYSSQLAQLREMGFLDTSMCLQALQQSRGNVSAAIENLINRFGG